MAYGQPITRERLIKALKHHKTPRDIGYALDCSRPSVTRALSRYGLKCDSPNDRSVDGEAPKRPRPNYLAAQQEADRVLALVAEGRARRGD